MDFEWKYVTAKRKFKWPLLVRLVVLVMRRRVTFGDAVQLYSTCRVCTLGCVICNFIISDVSHEIDCMV